MAQQPAEDWFDITNEQDDWVDVSTQGYQDYGRMFGPPAPTQDYFDYGRKFGPSAPELPRISTSGAAPISAPSAEPSSWYEDVFTIPNALRFGGSALGSIAGAVAAPYTAGASLALMGAGGAAGEAAARWWEGKPFDPTITAVEGALNLIPGGGALPGKGAALREIGKYAARQAGHGAWQGAAGSFPRHLAEEGTLLSPSEWTAPSLGNIAGQTVAGTAIGGTMGGAAGKFLPGVLPGAKPKPKATSTPDIDLPLQQPQAQVPRGLIDPMAEPALTRIEPESPYTTPEEQAEIIARLNEVAPREPVQQSLLEFVDPNTGEVVPASQARPGMVPLVPGEPLISNVEPSLIPGVRRTERPAPRPPKRETPRDWAERLIKEESGELNFGTLQEGLRRKTQELRQGLTEEVEPTGRPTPEETASDIENLGLANLRGEQVPGAIRYYGNIGRTDLVEYLGNRYGGQRARAGSPESYAQTVDQISQMSATEAETYIRTIESGIPPEDLGPFIEALRRSPIISPSVIRVRNYLQRRQTELLQRDLRAARPSNAEVIEQLTNMDSIQAYAYMEELENRILPEDIGPIIEALRAHGNRSTGLLTGRGYLLRRQREMRAQGIRTGPVTNLRYDFGETPSANRVPTNDDMLDASTADLRGFITRAEGRDLHPEQVQFARDVISEREQGPRYGQPSRGQESRARGGRGESSYSDVAEQIRGMRPNEVDNFISEHVDELYPQDIRPLIDELSNNPTDGTRRAVSWLEARIEQLEQQGISTRRRESDFEYTARGKTLEEVEAAKKTPALERLGKLIGEERAQELVSGQKEIQFSTPAQTRRGGKKKLSKGEILGWSRWGDTTIQDHVSPDPRRPGLTVIADSSDYFPNAFTVEYRDTDGAPIGVLRTNLDGNGISTLAVKSDLGLRRGKVAFEMLKQAWDRGVTEPSGTTSDLTKNLIERVKKLAARATRGEEGELDFATLYNSINKLIDDFNKTPFGKTVGRFITEEGGSLNTERFEELFQKYRAGNITPEELAEAKGLAGEYRSTPSAGQFTADLSDRLQRALQEPNVAPEEISGMLDELDELVRLNPKIDKPGLIRQVLGVNKALLTSWDISAPGRQGKAFILNKAWWTSWDDMFKAWGSKEGAKLVEQSIIDDPSGYFKRGQREVNGVMRETKSFAEKVGLDLAIREEPFQTEALKTLQKWSGIDKSSRAHTAFLNKLRADQFKAMMKAAEDAGLDPMNNLELPRKYAEFINSATGRGSLDVGKWKLSRVTSTMNDVFFAPKNLSGQIRTWNNVLNPMRYAQYDPVMRKQALKSLFAIAGLGAGTVAMADLGGLDVDYNPTSSDFMKIRHKDTRYDLFGGYQQFPVAAIKFLSGYQTPTTGENAGRMQNMDATDKGIITTRGDIAQRFFTNRLSPLGSFVWAWMFNKEFDGKPFEYKRALFERTFPIVAKDMVELAQINPLLAAVMAAPSAAGFVATQHYTGR